MQINNIGIVLASFDPEKTSNFYVENFNFKLLGNAGDWYFTHEHPDMKGVYLDVLKNGHQALGKSLEYGINESTNFIAFIVEDIEEEFKKFKSKNVKLLTEISVEPWGQKRFQLLAPDNVIIEIVQPTEPDFEWLENNMS